MALACGGPRPGERLLRAHRLRSAGHRAGVLAAGLRRLEQGQCLADVMRGEKASVCDVPARRSLRDVPVVFALGRPRDSATRLGGAHQWDMACLLAACVEPQSAPCPRRARVATASRPRRSRASRRVGSQRRTLPASTHTHRLACRVRSYTQCFQGIDGTNHSAAALHLRPCPACPAVT